MPRQEPSKIVKIRTPTLICYHHGTFRSQSNTANCPSNNIFYNKRKIHPEILTVFSHLISFVSFHLEQSLRFPFLFISLTITKITGQLLHRSFLHWSLADGSSWSDSGFTSLARTLQKWWCVSVYLCASHLEIRASVSCHRPCHFDPLINVLSALFLTRKSLSLSV